MKHLGYIEVSQHHHHRLLEKSPRLPRSKNTNVRSGNKRTDSRVIINVSGRNYETFVSTLQKYPDTLLGNATNRLHLTDKKTGHLFINRNPLCFEAVLFFYQSSGNLIRPKMIVMSLFEEECRYYQIPEDAIKRMKNRESFLYRRKKDLPKPYQDSDSFAYRSWVFFEKPKQFFIPWISKSYFLLYYLAVVLSIALFCIETEMYLHLRNKHSMEEYQVVHAYAEIGLNVFFIAELSCRFMTSPFQKDFFRQPTNLMELLSVLIFAVFYGLPNSVYRRDIMFFSRMLCISRLTRLGRISKVVKTSFAVFFESTEDVLAVLFTMLIIVIFGGTVMYYMESDVPLTKFKSIPDSMWWAVQTSLCLGYGDIVPQTFFGRYLGMFILYSGVVVVMVLILSLGGRVFDMYIKEFDEKCEGFLPDLNDSKNEDLEIHYREDDEVNLKRNKSKHR